MKSQIILLLLAMAVVANAQAPQEGLKHTTTSVPPGQASNDPVTLTEAHMFLTKVEGAVAQVNKIKKTPPLAIGTGKGPVSREAILIEFDRLFEMVKPSFSNKPRMASYDAKVFKLANPAALKAGSKLAKWGCVEPVSVLLVGPTETLTPTQFGDAVGYFIARIAELTHIPSTKFSPYLETDGG